MNEITIEGEFIGVVPFGEQNRGLFCGPEWELFVIPFTYGYDFGSWYSIIIKNEIRWEGPKNKKPTIYYLDEEKHYQWIPPDCETKIFVHSPSSIAKLKPIFVKPRSEHPLQKEKKKETLNFDQVNVEDIINFIELAVIGLVGYAVFHGHRSGVDCWVCNYRGLVFLGGSVITGIYMELIGEEIIEYLK